MGTSDFLLSFFSTFPTSLSNLCINFPFFFFAFFPFIYGAGSSCPEIWFRLKESELVALQWFPESPGADTDDFCMGDFCQIFFILTLFVTLTFFIQLLCNASLLSSNFHSGEEMVFVTELILHLFLLLCIWRLTLCSSGQEEGKSFLPFIAKKGGKAVWMDLVWYWVLYIRLSFNWIWCLFGLYSVIIIISKY